MINSRTIQIKDILNKTFTMSTSGSNEQPHSLKKEVIANVYDKKGKSWLVVKNTNGGASENVQYVSPKMFISWVKVNGNRLSIAS